jgi:hypothetical protein
MAMKDGRLKRAARLSVAAESCCRAENSLRLPKVLKYRSRIYFMCGIRSVKKMHAAVRIV